MTLEATRTYTDNPTDEDARPAIGMDISKWLNQSKALAHSVPDATFTWDQPPTNAWLSPATIDEAKLRFKDALEDAKEEEEPAPSDVALTNALRAVQMIDAHCPQDVSSTVVLDGGIETTTRGSNRNYISVECQKDGDVLVMFNVRSYARYENMGEAEHAGFLKALLETLRY